MRNKKEICIVTANKKATKKITDAIYRRTFKGINKTKTERNHE